MPSSFDREPRTICFSSLGGWHAVPGEVLRMKGATSVSLSSYVLAFKQSHDGHVQLQALH